jgi:hypothetical protein
MIKTLGERVKEDPGTYGSVSLMLDAMAIRQKIIYDPQKKCMTGFVNLGDGTDSDIQAKEALVVMVVGLKGHWKAPIAYYLTRVLTADVQAQLIKHSLEALADVGIRVWAVTMDGHSTNLAMCRELGCSLDTTGQSHFQHPQTAENVYVLFDACHMLKLVRNLLGDYSIIQSPDGLVRWSYVKYLQDQQEDAGLRLGNCLTSTHLNYYKMKMKVSLAAQTISSSVALALECLEQAGYDRFKGCQATVKFIKVNYCLVCNEFCFSRILL